MRFVRGLALTVLLLLSVATGEAAAKLSLSSFQFTSTTSQAGGHPDLTTSVVIAEDGVNPYIDGMSGLLRDLSVDLPAGFSGNPHAVPKCNPVDFESIFPGCPAATQIGTFFGHSTIGVEPKFPVYNLTPQNDGEAARFGFNALGSKVYLRIGVRNGGDYGLHIETRSLLRFVFLTDFKLELWGVPADPSHDTERWDAFGNPLAGWDEFGNPLPYRMPLPPRPLIDNPTTCGAPLPETELRATSYEEPDVAITVAPDEPLAPLTGCQNLRFTPTLRLKPESAVAASPSAYQVNLEVPQPAEPAEGVTPPASAHLRDAVVTLPQGTAVSPSAAEGLGACMDEQLAVAGDGSFNCPASARIGTAEFDVPALEGPLQGGIYLRTPAPGALLRLMLVGRGHGVDLRIPGKVELDSQTGQLTAVFRNAPQQTFSELRMRFFGGPQASLVNPPSCGQYTTKSEFTSWSGQEQTSFDQFTIDDDCGTGGFSPGLSAGTANPSAGASSPFLLRVTREDGEQNLSRIDAALPEGLLAKLAGVPLCGEAEAASGACPQPSRIGKVTAGVGAGTSPLYLPQAGKSPTALYLAGPYKGAPYSLVAVVPAQAGPFDLGTVAVRSAIEIDPTTTAVTVKSDPLPQILEGIPVAYRDVRVEVDRDGFMRNPTGCEPMAVAATITSAQGTSVERSRRFKVGDCASLSFAPKLSLRLSGPTHRRAHPALRAVLKMGKGGANVARAQVTLPRSELLEQSHIRTICTRVQYAADSCPKASVYGYATAYTPLLDEPLEGPVYLRSSNHQLPDLVASLDGQIHVDLAGRIDSVNERMRTTFWAVPDAPVSKFVLTMQGGRKGLLVNNTELCGRAPRAKVLLDGQNGKTYAAAPAVETGCGKKR